MNILSVFFDSFNKGILFYLKMFCLILQWRFTLLFIILNPLLFQIFHLVDWKGLLWYGYIKRAIRTQIFDWIKGQDRAGQKESKLKIPRRKECGYPEISRTIFSPHNSTQISLRMWEKIKCDNLLFSWFLLNPIAMQSLKSEVCGPFEFPFYSETFLWCRTSRKIMFRCPGKVVLD